MSPIALPSLCHLPIGTPPETVHTPEHEVENAFKPALDQVIQLLPAPSDNKQWPIDLLEGKDGDALMKLVNLGKTAWAVFDERQRNAAAEKKIKAEAQKEAAKAKARADAIAWLSNSGLKDGDAVKIVIYGSRRHDVQAIRVKYIGDEPQIVGSFVAVAELKEDENNQKLVTSPGDENQQATEPVVRTLSSEILQQVSQTFPRMRDKITLAVSVERRTAQAKTANASLAPAALSEEDILLFDLEHLIEGKFTVEKAVGDAPAAEPVPTIDESIQIVQEAKRNRRGGQVRVFFLNGMELIDEFEGKHSGSSKNRYFPPHSTLDGDIQAWTDKNIEITWYKDVTTHEVKIDTTLVKQGKVRIRKKVVES